MVGIHHWRQPASVLTELGLFKHVNATVPQTQWQCPCRAGWRGGWEASQMYIFNLLAFVSFVLLPVPVLSVLRGPCCIHSSL